MQFFKNAADPDSPLSPFSPESEHARVEAISVHRSVLAGTKTKVPAELRDILPELMWLSQMGLVLYWIFDRTEGASGATASPNAAPGSPRGVSYWPASGCCARWCARCTSCSGTSCPE